MRDRGLASSSDAELLHDEADPAHTFALFYRRHFSAVLRFVASRSVDIDAAADIVSETFISAMAHRYRYSPRHETARLWLLAIAANKLIDAKRREAINMKRHRLLHESYPLTETDRSDYEDLLALDEEPAVAALSDLAPSHRKLIEARIIEEREYADLANELGLSEAAVRQRVSRGLNVMRATMERRDD